MHNSISTRELASLRDGAYLINIARGGLVDHKALYEALQQGHIAGAGLDVFYTEPAPANEPLLQLPNVIITPHVGGVTEDSFRDIADVVAANVERLRHGGPLLHQVV